MFSSYIRFIQKLKVICRQKNFKIKTLGYIQKRKYPLFAVIVNSHSPNKNTLCFTAGIHGDERSGPTAILAFLKNYQSQNIHPKIIILPICNPTGYDQKTYHNIFNRNINRHFGDKPLSNENAILYRAVINKKIGFFLALHEDDKKSCVYAYTYYQKKDQPKKFNKLLSKSFPSGSICQAKKIYGLKADRGIISNPPFDGSFEARAHRDGIPLAFCLEIKDSFPFKKRVALNLKVMKNIIRFFR